MCVYVCVLDKYSTWSHCSGIFSGLCRRSATPKPPINFSAAGKAPEHALQLSLCVCVFTQFALFAFLALLCNLFLFLWFTAAAAASKVFTNKLSVNFGAFLEFIYFFRHFLLRWPLAVGYEFFNELVVITFKLLFPRWAWFLFKDIFTAEILSRFDVKPFFWRNWVKFFFLQFSISFERKVVFFI